MCRFRLLLLTAVLLSCSASISASITVLVPEEFPTIQSAIDYALNGDAISVGPGSYSENLDYAGKELVIFGRDGAESTILEPQNSGVPTVQLVECLTGTELRDFTIRGSRASMAVRVEGATSATISGNIFYDNLVTETVIKCDNTSSPLIIRNVFYENGGISCVGVYSGSASIINNTFDRNQRGFFSQSTAAVAKNNIVTNSVEYGIADNRFAEQSYNCVYNNHPNYAYDAVEGEGSIVADPQFTDAVNFDFSISWESPCRDAGDPDPSYNDPDGSRNDMGAIPVYYGTPPIAIYFNLGPDSTFNAVNHTPTFFWSFYGPGSSQVAVELEVGSDENWVVAELWATGQITTADTSMVYAGSPLSDGELYYVRLRVYDGADWGSWAQFSFRMNTPPGTPIPILPTDGSTLKWIDAYLTVRNATDAEGDPLYYDFEVADDLGFTNIIYTDLDVPEEPTETESGLIQGLVEGVTYYWRSRASDIVETGDWSATSTFQVLGPEVIRIPLDQPTIQAGLDLAVEGDTILVAPGNYTGSLDFHGKGVILHSWSGPESTVLECTVDAGGVSQFGEVSGFTITGASEISATSGSEIVIRDNIFHSVTGEAISCSGAGPYITRNIFYECGGISCVAVYSGAARIINNTFDRNNRGFFSQGGEAIAINNIVTNSLEYGIADDQFAVQMYNCVFNNNPDYDYGATAGTGSISEDPQYMDGENHVYLLETSSPCIDAGDPDPEYFDEDGSRNDMGAIPLNVGNPPVALNLNLGDETLSNVVSHVPTLYWSFYDTVGSQVAYIIEVGTDEDWTAAEMWATGEVYTGDTSVVYAGSVLVDGTAYFVRIRIYNGTDWGDWKYYSFTMNTVPVTPALSYPTDQGRANVLDLRLVTHNVQDGDGDPLLYEFQVSADPSFTSILDSDQAAAQFDQTFSKAFSLAVGTEYWWRCRSDDGFEQSGWSVVSSFTASEEVLIRIPQDQTTIQRGIDVAAHGDTVLVSPGVYSENIVFEGKAVLVVSEAGQGSTFLQQKSIGLPIVLFQNGEDTLSVLRGFTIELAQNTSAIQCLNSSPLIEGCRIRNCVTPGNASAIYLNSSAAVIRENLIHDNEAGASSGGGAIWGEGNVDLVIVSNSVFGNSIGTRAAISVSSASGTVRIERNLIYNNTGGESPNGVLVQGAMAMVLNNTFFGNARGIVFGLGGQPGDSILNNIVVGCDQDGISAADAYVDYNNVWQNGTQNNPGPHGISADPLFVDASIGDFSLLPASPCIDAGHPDEAFVDIDASRSDVGAIPHIHGLPVASYLNFGEGTMLRVVDHSPTIYWSYYDTASTQQGFELEVGSDLDWSTAEQWTTGQVISTDTSIAYDGLALLDGDTYYIRIRVTDGTVWGDWREYTFHMNSIPTSPLPVAPADQGFVNFHEVRLEVDNSVDSDGDAKTYDFEVANDVTFTNIIVSQSGIEESSPATKSDPITALSEAQEYWWRCRAWDGHEHSGWSAGRSFTTVPSIVITVPEDEPTIQDGIDAAVEGDSVVVSPGTYTENLQLVGKNIVIRSRSGAATTTIQPSSTQSPVLTITTASSECEFSGFTITGCQGNYAIDIASQADVSILRNVFRDNPIGSVVIRSADGSSPLIAFNLFYGNSGASCVGVWSSAGATHILNNTFDGNARGFYSQDDQTVAKNNIVTNSTEYGIADTRFAELSYNCVFNNNPDYDYGAQPGTGSLSTDPLYVDRAAGDYNLEWTSPCVDAGDPDPQYNDADGTRNDMGAFPIDLQLPVITQFSLGDENVNRVVDHTPTFHWLYYDTLGPQQGYEVEVGSDQTWDVAEYWASGQVSSVDTFTTYAGETLADGAVCYVRMRVFNGTDWGDWSEYSFRLNTVPTVPPIAFPDDEGVVNVLGSPLVVNNSVDGDGDGITYDFEVCADSSFSDLQLADYGISEGQLQSLSSVIAGLSVGETWFWRCRANDAYETGNWSDVWSFDVAEGVTIRVPTHRYGIQPAIDLAAAGDTVLVASGTYTDNIDFNGKAILVTSESGREQTILEPAVGGQSIVEFRSSEDSLSVIRGFSLRGASGISGLQCLESSPIVEYCEIYDCTTPHDGGGIYLRNSAAKIRHNVIHDNICAANRYGGGIFSQKTLGAEISYNEIYSNVATHGPGIGIFSTGGYITIHHNIVHHNAGDGFMAGGIFVSGEECMILNNTVHANSKGIYLFNGGSSADTVYNNIASNNVLDGIYAGASVTDYNNVWQNGSYNEPGPNGLYVDPVYTALPINDYSLQPTSGCINTGNPDPIYTDADGSRNDIGAIPFILASPCVRNLSVIDEVPSHVVAHLPQFAWDFHDTLHNQTQVEIAIGTDSLWQNADMWDPGVLPLTDTFVDYGGEVLVDGSTYYARIRASNGEVWTNWVGLTFHMNTVPSVPTLLLPDDNALVISNPLLWLTNSTDAEGDPLLYDFRCLPDPVSGGGDPIEVFDVPEGDDSTGWQVSSPMVENSVYFWSARSTDGYEHSDWTQPRTISVNGYNESPAAPICQSPPSTSDSIHYDMRPTFIWEASVDPDPGDTVWYKIILGTDECLVFTASMDSILTNSYLWHDSLDFQAEYWWTVLAYDLDGSMVLAADTVKFYTWALGDVNHDHIVELTDVLAMASAAFLGGPPIEPAFIGDVTGDCMMELTDILRLASYLFLGGDPPVPGCDPQGASDIPAGEGTDTITQPEEATAKSSQETQPNQR